MTVIGARNALETWLRLRLSAQSKRFLAPCRPPHDVILSEAKNPPIQESRNMRMRRADEHR